MGRRSRNHRGPRVHRPNGCIEVRGTDVVTWQGSFDSRQGPDAVLGKQSARPGNRLPIALPVSAYAPWVAIVAKVDDAMRIGNLLGRNTA